jgi:[ribosomal protein S5]-alanine N-acetyltransferase
MPYNFTPFPTIETERLLLRQLTPADDQDIYFQRTDKTMNQYIIRATETLDDARNWITRINNIIAANEGINWGIAIKDTKRLIGGFCYWNMAPQENKGEIGFSLHPEYWGKGLMQEAITATLQYGVHVMGLETVEAYTHPENGRSIKLLERNGFRLVRSPEPGGEEPYAVYVLKTVKN